ncbi:uncharacterized protein DUF2752 [Nocardia puris]|uniref:Uncharacterized protein DUF2752 n=1 Tax=Nocardia puris TaxID=208602 RepID=A0A366DBC2_9NOCA|nr:uncharacterized protein DUF2752 [Nocardia puris]
MFLVDTAHFATQPSPPPQRVRKTGWRALGWPLLAAGAGVGAVALLHFRDPHVEGSYGLCPLYALTGVYCPGCGGMRAVHNLTDGRILDSLQSNLIAIPLLLALALFIGDWGMRAWRGDKPRVPDIPRPLLWILLAFLAVYAVVRNTPWGTWLAPV